MNRAVVIILNWNGIKDTINCIKSLKKQTYAYYDILIVDNGSNNNSITKLKKIKEKNINIIYNPKNLGFAGGVNTGINWAISNNYDYVALFNNDAIADKEWLKELINAITKDKSIGIATSLLLDYYGDKIDSTGEQYSNWGLPFPRNRGNKRNKAPDEQMVFGATGGASLYKTDMFKKIGLFDDDFFAYYEDTDISFRAQLDGYKIVYNPKAVAYHKQGETSKKIPGFTVYQTFKNLPLLFIKNVPVKLLIPIGVRFYFAYWLMFFNAIKNGNGKSATKGLFMGFILFFKKIIERFKIQKNKKVSADYIKSILWHDLPPDQTGLRKLRRFFIKK